jgi:hypothetical protein
MFAIKPLELKAVTKGWPVEAGELPGVSWHADGVPDIGVLKVTGAEVEDDIETLPVLVSGIMLPVHGTFTDGHALGP